MKWTVNSDTSLQSFIGDVREEYRQHHYLRVDIRTGKDRSLNQNDILHVWIEQIARELREDDALGWKCYVKLTIGVPILRAENEDFRAGYDASIKHLTYEQKIKAMAFVPVSSLMTKLQLSKPLETMQSYFMDLGVILEFPPEEQY